MIYGTNKKDVLMVFFIKNDLNTYCEKMNHICDSFF